MKVRKSVQRWSMVGLVCAGLGACKSESVEPPVEPGPEPVPPFIMGGGTGGVAGGSDGGVRPFPVGGSTGFSGPVVSADRAPPPISGGTLLMLSDGKTAFAADPDRDTLYLADLEKERLLATLPLSPGDEPGRSVQDPKGVVHVVLRRGGAVVTVNPATATIESRRAVCPAPRGIAHDSREDALFVTCAGGEVVVLPTTGETPLRTMKLERDLRDVVVSNGKIYVSRFRTAELLVLGLDGRVLERWVPPGSRVASAQLRRPPTADGGAGATGSMSSPPPPTGATPVVAWRLRALPDGKGVAMVHQESSNAELGTMPGGYAAGACKGGPVAAGMTRFPEGAAAATSGQLMFATLPVDFAYSRDGKRVAMVAAGNSVNTQNRIGPPVYFMNTTQAETGDCVFPNPPQPEPGEIPLEFRQPVGESVAVVFDGLGRVVVQTREPARLEILTHRGGSIKLSDESRADTGHQVFHAATSIGLACASCHPEGGDDGRTWTFTNIGKRRTQDLRGGILGTAPFHWDGDMRDMTQLMSEVFSGRMAGPRLAPEHVTAMAKWIDRVPTLPTTMPADPTAVARGKALFESPKTGCATCHSGPTLTNNQTVNAGTGKPMQVPGLRGIVHRAPFMHTGCAPTLKDRFTAPCGGGDQHGVTSHLSAAQIDDLVAYLESL